MTKIHLSPGMFEGREALLAEHGSLKAYAFRYASGVPALKLNSPEGELILLPYHGQQVWSAAFHGRALAMKTMFDEPTGSREFSQNYGGFLLHCGLTGIGGAGEGDDHPTHGELPNARYQSACLLAGEDARGRYLALTGVSRLLRSFSLGYEFEPECRLYEDRTTFTERVSIRNLRNAPMPYVYLCHINFRPVDGARLIDTARSAPGEYAVHLKGVNDPLLLYAARLKDDLSISRTVDREAQCYDPEICVTLRYLPDEDGWGHTLQRLPDGGAHYVRHPVAALPVPVRWIARTSDEDAMGMVLPATSEHLGYQNALKKGQVCCLPANGACTFEMEIGLLDEAEAAHVERQIERVLKEAESP